MQGVDWLRGSIPQRAILTTASANVSQLH